MNVQVRVCDGLLAPYRHQPARQLGKDTLTRSRRVLGDDHPHTLRLAHNLTAVSGEYG
jgi:hypothetical protein